MILSEEENKLRSFSDYNPLAVFIYYFCIMLPIMFFQNPLLSIIGILSGVLYYLIRNGIKGIKNIWWIFVLVIVGAAINPLFMHNGVTVLFVINDSPITLEALLFGLCSGIMIASVIAWFASFNQIMTSDKLLYIFGSVSPKIALILSMTLRYIPLFKQQITKTNNAQKAMGLYKEENLIDKVRGGIRIFSVMVTWALENGVITADSMTARGYGIGKRSRFAIFKWEKQDYMLLAASLLFTGITCISGFMGLFKINWYPAITYADGGALTIISYTAFTLLCLIPDYLQVREETKWKSLQSRI